MWFKDVTLSWLSHPSRRRHAQSSDMAVGTRGSEMVKTFHIGVIREHGDVRAAVVGLRVAGVALGGGDAAVRSKVAVAFVGRIDRDAAQQVRDLAASHER